MMGVGGSFDFISGVAARAPALDSEYRFRVAASLNPTALALEEDVGVAEIRDRSDA